MIPSGQANSPEVVWSWTDPAAKGMLYGEVRTLVSLEWPTHPQPSGPAMAELVSGAAVYMAWVRSL